MKLAKALKEKNRLAGEVARLKEIINRENSRDVKSTSKVDVPQTWEKFKVATEALIKIKAAIFKANTGIYESIVRIGELKGLAAWIPEINTLDRVTEQPYGISNQIVRTEIKAWLTQEKADEEVAGLQEEIGKLQDQIDAYNATVEVIV